MMRVGRGMPPVGILRRRENLANKEARDLIGSLYMILALRLDRKALKRAADWKGVIENTSIALRRYADGEAHQLLIGDGAYGRPIRVKLDEVKR